MARNDKKKQDDAKDTLEKGVIAIAEQLGWFLGTVRAKADGLLENEVVAKQVSTIRDGAMELLARAGKASSSARESVTSAVGPAVKVAQDAAERATKAVAKPVAKSVAKPAAKPVAKPALKPAVKTAGRSGGTVDAPGKKHRKAPARASSISKRMGEVTGKKAGQKQFKVGKSRGRG